MLSDPWLQPSAGPVSCIQDTHLCLGPGSQPHSAFLQHSYWVLERDLWPVSPCSNCLPSPQVWPGSHPTLPLISLNPRIEWTVKTSLSGFSFCEAPCHGILCPEYNQAQPGCCYLGTRPCCHAEGFSHKRGICEALVSGDQV